MILDEPVPEHVRITDIYEDRLLTRHERNEFGQMERRQIEMRYRRPVQTLSTNLRFVNLAIDMTILYSIDVFLHIYLLTLGFPILFADLFKIPLFYGYFFLAEYFFQQTIGKMVTGSVVVNDFGERPDFQSLVARTLVRFIPFEVFSFFNSERGWHDKWSNTWVLSKKELKAIRHLMSDPKNLQP